ncbi:MAG: hypothetical protein KIT43_11120 [Bauldia sp.]|nr:hypothetical protein [Bauldia sp.]
MSRTKALPRASAALRSPAEYDVAIIADMTVPGEPAFRIAREVESFSSAGHSVALVHLRSSTSRPRIAPDVQGCVGAGMADPVQPVRGVSAGRAILHGPHLIESPPARLKGLRTPEITVVADRIASYDASALDGWLRRVAPVIWAPATRRIREALSAGHPGLVVMDEDWPLPPAAPADRALDRPIPRRLVIGQIGGEGAWPGSFEEMQALFPTDGAYDVRLLGRLPAELARPAYGWRQIDFDQMSVAQFIRRLDALLYYPANPEIPLDAVAAWFLAQGRPVLMDPVLRHRYGAGPVYTAALDAVEALRRYVLDPVIQAAARKTALAGASRMTAAWPEPEDRGVVERRASGRPVLLFVTSNGTGLGHVSRLLAIARRLQDFEPVFVTMAQAVEAIEAFGFVAEYLPSHQYSGAEPHLWDEWFRAELELLIESYNAVGVVYDGNGPTPGLIGAAGSRGRCGLAWVRGGMAGAAAVPNIEDSHYFDLIVEPGETAEEADHGETTRRRGEVERVDPILLLDPSELLSREEAAAALGLDPARPAALIQLGTGSNRDIVTLIDRVIAGLADSGTQVVIAEWSSAAGLPPLWPEAIIVSGHPLAQYYRAFDFTVAAAGYNTFHEVIAYAVPAIFVANGHHSMDDQVGRARHAEANGLALALDERDLSELPEMLKVMLSGPAREFLRENCRRHAAPNGAEAAARLIGERLGRGVSIVRRRTL